MTSLEMSCLRRKSEEMFCFRMKSEEMFYVWVMSEGSDVTGPYRKDVLGQDETCEGIVRKNVLCKNDMQKN
jgi:hypothetical protein